MIYVILFEDNPDKVHMRSDFMSEHLKFLNGHSEKIYAAGPISEASSGSPAGGMWMVEAANLAEVEALVQMDPFWSTGLRKSFRVLLWSHVYSTMWIADDGK